MKENNQIAKRKLVIFPIILTLIFCSSLLAVDDIPRWGIGLRLSSFGVPNSLVDAFAYEHPTFAGHSLSFELRSYGKKGPRSSVGALFSLEYSRLGGSGPWGENKDSKQLDIEGEVSQVNLTFTLLVGIFPSWAVHPYFGIGLGVGKAYVWSEGTYADDDPNTAVKETYLQNLFVPVVHLPVGFMINISNKVEIRLEGGFKNGFYVGGAVVYNF